MHDFANRQARICAPFSPREMRRANVLSSLSSPLLRRPIVASAAQISSSWGGTPAVISKSFCVGALRGICLPTIIPTSLSDRFRDASPSLFRHLAQKNDMLARVPLAIISFVCRNRQTISRTAPYKTLINIALIPSILNLIDAIYSDILLFMSCEISR